MFNKKYNKQILVYFGKCLGVIDRIRQLIPAPGGHVGESLFPDQQCTAAFRFQVNTARRDGDNYLALEPLHCPRALSYHVQWKH